MKPTKQHIAIALMCSALANGYAFNFKPQNSEDISPLPRHAIGTWVYNSTWSGDPKPWSKGADSDGLWMNALTSYEKNNPNYPIDQIIYYGGDLEAYCDGTEQKSADPSWKCNSNSFFMTFWGPYAGTYKLGDPTIDTSDAMKQTIANYKKTPPHKTKMDIRGTCMSLNNDGSCKAPNGIKKDFWDDYVAHDNDTKNNGLHVSSGYRSEDVYKNLNVDGQGLLHPSMVADIDGRLDVANTDADYLNGLNRMYNDKNGNRQIDAVHLADFVAKNLCVDDNLDGVQFDLEPFCFDGSCGVLTGSDSSGHNGQYYFYKEIAKDFAGFYDHTDDPAGINNEKNSYGDYTDPLHCVDRAHPNGRFFSTFTFASRVTPAVGDVFTHHNNGMIVDSLYDLSTDTNILKEVGSSSPAEPGGYPLCPNVPTKLTLNGQSYLYPAMRDLVKQEVKDMQAVAQKYNLAYQFAIPGGASAHEFESRDMYINGSSTSTPLTTECGATKPVPVSQDQYIKVDLDAITTVHQDPNYRGYDIYGWSQQSWWADTSNTSGTQFSLKPAFPSAASKVWAQGDGSPHQ